MHNLFSRIVNNLVLLSLSLNWFYYITTINLVQIVNSSWIPEEVASRVISMNANRINKAGELLLTSQESRYMPAVTVHTITSYSI